MSKYKNGTSHEIKFFSIKDTESSSDGRKLFLKEGAVPILVIEPGVNLNCVKSNAVAPDNIKSEVPLKGAVVFLSHDPVPNEGDFVVVSNLFRSAVRELGGDTSRLATVDGTVYASPEDTRPCGCLSLAVG